MTADQLRAALDSYSPWHGMGADAYEDIEAVARSWLNLLQADEATIEKVAQYLYESDYPSREYESWSDDDQRRWINYDERMKALYMHRARAVLAAIVGEEQK